VLVVPSDLRINNAKILRVVVGIQGNDALSVERKLRLFRILFFSALGRAAWVFKGIALIQYQFCEGVCRRRLQQCPSVNPRRPKVALYMSSALTSGLSFSF
jgi:hypothetical protein